MKIHKEHRSVLSERQRRIDSNIYLGINFDNSAAADDDDDDDDGACFCVPSLVTIPPAVAIPDHDCLTEMTESDPHPENKKNRAKKKKIAPLDEEELSFEGGVKFSEKSLPKTICRSLSKKKVMTIIQ